MSRNWEFLRRKWSIWAWIRYVNYICQSFFDCFYFICYFFYSLLSLWWKLLQNKMLKNGYEYIWRKRNLELIADLSQSQVRVPLYLNVSWSLPRIISGPLILAVPYMFCVPAIIEYLYDFYGISLFKCFQWTLISYWKNIILYSLSFPLRPLDLNEMKRKQEMNVLFLFWRRISSICFWNVPIQCEEVIFYWSKYN